MYFSSKTGSGKKVTMTKDIGEYNLLKFMWSEFGISPKELESYDQEWVEKMILISNTEGEVESREMERSSSHRPASSSRSNLNMGRSF